MTNIAMENPSKWRFLAGKIIFKWAIYTMTMLNNQRVISISEGFDESICWQQCSINKIIVPMDRPLNDTQQIYDQE